MIKVSKYISSCQTTIPSYFDHTNDEARTWVPLNKDGYEGFEFEEVTIKGHAQLVFEVLPEAYETQHILIHQLSGPVPEKSHLYGRLHVGPDQYIEIRNCPYFFPVNIETYLFSILVIPPRLQFHGHQSSVEGAVSGLKELIVSGGSLTFHQDSGTLTGPGSKTLQLDSLQVKNDGVVNVGDGLDLFTLQTQSLDLTSGSILRGRKLLIETERLHIEGTAELKVWGFDDNPRGIAITTNMLHLYSNQVL